MNSKTEVRVWRFAAVALFGAICVAAGMFTVQVSHLFELRNSDGARKAYWYIADGTDTPGIWFCDMLGRDRLFIGLNIDDDPLILFRNAKGEDCHYIQIDGSHEGTPPVKTKSARGPLWPPEDSILWNKLVKINDGGLDRIFHCADCPHCSRKNISTKTIRQAHDLRKEPCRECLSELWD